MISRTARGLPNTETVRHTNNINKKRTNMTRMVEFTPRTKARKVLETILLREQQDKGIRVQTTVIPQEWIDIFPSFWEKRKEEVKWLLRFNAGA